MPVLYASRRAVCTAAGGQFGDSFENCRSQNQNYVQNCSQTGSLSPKLVRDKFWHQFQSHFEFDESSLSVSQSVISSGRSAFRSAKPTRTTQTSQKGKLTIHFEKAIHAASQGGVGSPEVQLAPRGAGWFYPPSQGFKETCN